MNRTPVRLRGQLSLFASCLVWPLAAGAQLAPAAPGAGVMFTGRTAEATSSSGVGGVDTDTETKEAPPNTFAPADIVATSTQMNQGSSASGSFRNVSEITTEAATGKVTIKGTLNSDGQAISAPNGQLAASQNNGQQQVTFDISSPASGYDYTLTGSMTGTLTINDARAFYDFEFVHGSQLIHRQSFDRREAGQVTRTLAASGRFFTASGLRITVTSAFDAIAASSVEGRNASAVGRCNFILELTPVGAPTPTPTPIPTPTATPTPTPPEVRWIKTDGGSFNSAGHWSPERIPTVHDTAVFDLAGAYLVTLDESVTNKRLRANGAGVNVVFDLGGNTYSVDQFSSGGLGGDNVSLRFLGGDAPVGAAALKRTDVGALAATDAGEIRVLRLDVGSGAVQTYAEGASVYGSLINVEGSLNGDDPGTLIEAPEFNVGSTATDATVLVSEGARIANTSATVGVQAAGRGVVGLFEGSMWEITQRLVLGEAGNAEVEIASGSIVRAQDCSIGRAAGSQGMLLVNDAESQLEVVFSLTVGQNGTGTLLLRRAGELQSRVLSIGSRTGSSGVVTVEDEFTLLETNTLSVGSEGTGALTIADSAEARCDQLQVGTGLSVAPGGIGHVRISDASLIADGEIAIGGMGAGTLTVEPFGFVSQPPSARAKVGDNSTLLCLAGGLARLGYTEIQPGGTLQASDGGRIAVDFTLQADGVVRVEGAGSVALGGGDGVPGKMRVGPGGILSGTGTVIATEIITVGGGINQFAGAQILPGNSPGNLTLQGNFTQEPGSKLVMESAGVNAGQFDVLRVTGNATLQGTLEINFLNGYLPKTGDVLPLLQIDGSVTGSFSQITFPQLLPGFQVSTALVQGNYRLTALNDAQRAPTHLLNISTRMQVGTGDNVLISGFIITGTEPKRVMIRGIGPSLSNAGITGALSDPTLELHDGIGALIAANDNWRTTAVGGVIAADQVAELQATTIPPGNEAEAALVVMLPPGPYTAIIGSANNTGGVGLAEVYDLSGAVPSKLANISTRGLVQTAENVMIGGFIVGNQTTKVIVRAIGPSLSLAGKLADPALELHDGNGATLATNDNWRSNQETEIIDTTIPPSHDFESAIVRTLLPGPYTAIVRGVNSTTGIALVEVYALN